MKRFYEHAEVIEAEGGYLVALDGHAIHTLSKKRMLLPSRQLAEAAAAEWRRQGKDVDPASMSLTRLIQTAIDDAAARPGEFVDAIVAYGLTDLTCHLAEGPEELTDRQRRQWQPLRGWLSDRHGIELAATMGVIPLRQSDEVIAALRRVVATDDPFALTGLLSATAACGSVVIALALRDGAIDVDQAWEAAQVDETYQNERWGEDAEAAERRKNIRADLNAAVLLLGQYSVD